jgi:hypothetical protein
MSATMRAAFDLFRLGLSHVACDCCAVCASAGKVAAANMAISAARASVSTRMLSRHSCQRNLWGGISAARPCCSLSAVSWGVMLLHCCVFLRIDRHTHSAYCRYPVRCHAAKRFAVSVDLQVTYNQLTLLANVTPRLEDVNTPPSSPGTGTFFDAVGWESMCAPCTPAGTGPHCQHWKSAVVGSLPRRPQACRYSIGVKSLAHAPLFQF